MVDDQDDEGAGRVGGAGRISHAVFRVAPTMARSITRLERAGFLRRSPNPADGRSMLIEATPASMSLRRSVERIWAELEALTVGSLTRDEQAAVPDALAGLEQQLLAAARARPSEAG